MRRNERRMLKSGESFSEFIDTLDGTPFDGMTALTRFAEASLTVPGKVERKRGSTGTDMSFTANSCIQELSDDELADLAQKQKGLAQLVVSQALTARREISLAQGNVIIHGPIGNVARARGSPESALSVYSHDSPTSSHEENTTEVSPKKADFRFHAISSGMSDSIYAGVELKSLIYKRMKHA